MADLQSPNHVQELCINLLAGKPDILWRWKDGSQLSKPNGVEWRDPQIFLVSAIADELLKIVSCKISFRDLGILSTFTLKNVHLQHVKISESDYLTEDMLQVLSEHKLISLDMGCPDAMNISTVIKCIGNKSNESLQHLLLPRRKELWLCDDWPRNDDLGGQSVIETLSRFNCLKRVDIRETGLSNTNLAILGKSLPHVENLNLSRNDRITDISPLKNCQKTLKSLSLGGVFPLAAESTLATFVTLTGLTYLDVSLLSYTFWEQSRSSGMKRFTADMLLQMPDVLPNLMCLDLSGRTVGSEQVLSQFLDAHQSLQMLVLWGSDACMFMSLQDYRPGLAVGGYATLEQYTAVLRHWTSTDKYEVNTCHQSLRPSVLNTLTKDLKKRNLPPCGNDCILKVMLGMIGTCSDPCEWSTCVLEFSCLGAISLLLRKRVTGALAPDTKEQLLQFCNRTLQKRPENRLRNVVLQIKKALREPIPSPL